MGLKQQKSELRLGNQPKLMLNDRELKTTDARHTKELGPEQITGNHFQLKKKAGSVGTDIVENTDFKSSEDSSITPSTKGSSVPAKSSSPLQTKKFLTSSNKAIESRNKTSSVLTPKGRYRHFRVSPTPGSELQELKVQRENRPRLSRRYRIRKNTESTYESYKPKHEEKQKYPRIRFQNQYTRPKDSIVQKGILIKSSQPHINYTLPTLKLDPIHKESYGINKKVNNQSVWDQDTGSSQHSINVSEKDSTRTRVPKDVRKDSVTSFTPIVKNKDNIPTKSLKPITLPAPTHTVVTHTSKTVPGKGLTASLGNAASNIAALTKSAALSASLSKSKSSFASPPKVYVPKLKVSAQPPVYVPVTTRAPSFKSIIPQIPVNSPVTASPLSPPVPNLNDGIKIPVAPSVKYALSYERRFLKPGKSNIGNVPSPKNPLVTPFNPYTTLFLPQYGGDNFGQLGPIHIPHQIPVLNLPLPQGGGYGF